MRNDPADDLYPAWHERLFSHDKPALAVTFDATLQGLHIVTALATSSHSGNGTRTQNHNAAKVQWRAVCVMEFRR